jgi:hypothetical protein
MAATRNGCFTSTPHVSFAQTRSFAATWRIDQFDPCSPIFAPRGVGLANRAPDAHGDAMLCIEDDFFADTQSGAASTASAERPVSQPEKSARPPGSLTPCARVK